MVLAASLLLASLVAFFVSGPEWSPVWFDMSFGFGAMLVGTIILRIVRAPRFEWPGGRFKFLAYAFGIVMLLPFIGMAVGLLAVTMFPILFFVPLYWWGARGMDDEHATHDAHAAPPLVPHHA